jgi:hypothetical protein
LNLLEIPEVVRPFLPLIQIAIYVVGAVAAVLAARRAWRWLRVQPLEDRLTVVAASIATAVSAQGMWRFTGDVLGLDGLLRAGLFAFIEVAVVTSAVRAKRSSRENFSAGVDGVAVWVLAALTAVLSSLDSRSFGEVVFRLAAPLVSAWMWERGMRLERRRMRGLSGINWRITPERILVRLGLAEVSDRTASEVDAHRRLTRVALAAKRAKALRVASASERKVGRALAKLDKALDKAVEHTGLARNEPMMRSLLDEVTTLYGGAKLMDLPDVAPWEHLDHPAVTGAAKNRDAVQLASALNEWSAALNSQRDPEARAAIQSMAAYIARLEGCPELRYETGDETQAPVDGEVSPVDIDDLIEKLRQEPPPPPDETSDETTDETRATDAMQRHWDQIVKVERRIPTGSELATAAGCSTQWGAKKARQWTAEMDGRTRRALQSGKKTEA